jgi:hypothetical protein
MATIPYSRTGTAFPRAKRNPRKIRAAAQRRYDRADREETREANKGGYIRRRYSAARLARKAAQEAQEKADIAAQLEAIHREPPPLTFRIVTGY